MNKPQRNYRDIAQARATFRRRQLAALAQAGFTCSEAEKPTADCATIGHTYAFVLGTGFVCTVCREEKY